MEGIFLSVICLGGLLLFGFPLLSYAFFWYETANSSYRRTLEELSGGKTARWLLIGYLTSVLSLAFVVVLYPLGLWRKLRHPAPQPEEGRPPILLVHGLYHNAAAWTLLRRRLQRAGFTNIYAFQYNSFGTSFQKILAHLEKYVDELEALFPDRPILLVGHSLGGLLCRALVEDPASHRRNVLGLITLGTPHHGSKLSALGVGRLAQSLIHRGPLVDWIEKNTSVVSRQPDTPTSKTAIYSPMDSMVLPNDALLPPSHDWELVRTAPISHVYMLFHAATFRQILKSASRAEKSAKETRNQG